MMDMKKFEKAQTNRQQKNDLVKMKASLEQKDQHITGISLTVSNDKDSIGGMVHNVSPGLIPVIAKTILKSIDDELAALDKEFKGL